MACAAFLVLPALGARPALAQHLHIVVHSAPLAGFQFYGGKILWEEMREGDPLRLIREPDNPHDRHAIRVEWRGETLGYLPRTVNSTLAEEMDRGTPISGRIGRMNTHPNPWKRIRVEVLVGL